MDTDLPDLPIRLAILAASLGLSAFFSGAETALFSFQPDELGRMRDATGADAAIAALRARPKRLLITILFGNMLANVVFFSVSFLMIRRLGDGLSAAGMVLLSVASLAVVLVLGEVVPKNVALTFYRRVGRAVAYPLMLIQKALLPVAFPLEKVADLATGLVGRGGPTVGTDELQVLVDVSAREGLVDAGAGRMIVEVLGLADVRINELMVPRLEMVSFNLRDPAEDLLELFRQRKMTAIPVYDGEMDEMKGLVHVKDALFRAEGRTQAQLAQPIPFLPETATVEEALRRCLGDGKKTAFVVDEYGAVIGLLTLEDLLEEIVGEISDEYDPHGPPDVEPLAAGAFRLQGAMSLRTWLDLCRAPMPELGVDTVGGLVMALLEKVPQEGDAVVYEGMEYTVETMDGRRAATVVARPAGTGGRDG